FGPEREVGVHPAPVRAGLASDIGGGGRHAQAFLGERILEPEGKRERIAGLRAKRVLQHDPVILALGRRPGGPADETVDGVARLELVERQLVLRAAELVRPVLDPVRPGDEHLPAAGAGHLFGAVAVEDVLASNGVGPQARTDLDDDDAPIPGAYLDLLAGRKGIRHQAASRSNRWSPTRSAFAIAVSAGFT